MAYDPAHAHARQAPLSPRELLRQQRGPQMNGSSRQPQEKPLWQQDLVTWLDQELARRRGAEGDRGPTEIYEREVAYSWVLVFMTSVRQPCWSRPQRETLSFCLST